MNNDPALQPLLLRIAAAVQTQPIPPKRAGWRMRWAERFVNFVGQPTSYAKPGAQCSRLSLRHSAQVD